LQQRSGFFQVDLSSLCPLAFSIDSNLVVVSEGPHSGRVPGMTLGSPLAQPVQERRDACIGQ